MVFDASGDLPLGSNDIVHPDLVYVAPYNRIDLMCVWRSLFANRGKPPSVARVVKSYKPGGKSSSPIEAVSLAFTIDCFELSNSGGAIPHRTTSDATIQG